MKTKRKRWPVPVKTTTELAAMAACKVINPECVCEHAPSVCGTMVHAARAVLLIAAPEIYERLGKADIEAAKQRERR